MGLQYSQQHNPLSDLEETSYPRNLLNATSLQNTVGPFIGIEAQVFPVIEIKKGFLISYPCKVEVLRPFYIKVQLVNEGFIATSIISDVYELANTYLDAVRSYLYSLVDELVWFQEQREILSPSMLKDFDKLHFHLRLV